MMAKASVHKAQQQADRAAAARATPQAQRADRAKRVATAAADRYAKAAARSRRPSYTRSAAAGAASGAAQGGQAGAAAGAATGLITAHGEKKEAARLRRAMRSPARKLLVAEYIVCMIILAFSPLTDKHGSDTAVKWMKRGTAMSVVFLLLGIISSGGERAEKVAAGFGGLVTLALLMNDRDIFAMMATRLTGAGPTSTGTGPHGSQDTNKTGTG
jgi:hypothetical protein